MENRFLSEEEIINNIKEYIDEDIYNSAILIDGEWGSGKTFFVKNKLIKELERYEKSKKRIEGKKYKEKRMIYISLYGIESTADISNQIYLSFLKINNSKMTSAFMLGGKVVSDLIKNKGIDLTNCVSKAKNIIDISNCILFFDDLERCKCNISNVLGYINNFVEHESMKVILIANEDEIGNMSYEKDLYHNKLKNERTEKNEKVSHEFMKAFDLYKEEKNQSKEERKVYDTSKIEEYSKIKEKLIGTTIKYKPNLENSVRNIIEKIDIEDYLKEQLVVNIPIFIKIAEENNHNNLRTFKFFISKMIKIYDLIKDKEYSRNEEVLKALMKYAFRVCIYLKKGIYMSVWKSNNLYGEVALEPYTANDDIDFMISDKTVKGFKFIDEFIVNSKSPHIEVIDRTIDIFLEDLKESENSDDPVNKLERYYMLEDEEVKAYISEICSSIKEKKYSPKRFVDVSKQLIIIKSIGFEIDEDIFDSMLKQIEDSNSNLDYNERIFYVSEDEEINKIYQEYYEKMKLAAAKGSDINIVQKINECLNNIDTWGSDLISLDNKNNIYDLEKGLLSSIDIDKIKSNIENSKTKQLNDFRGFIVSVYGNNSALVKKDKERMSYLVEFIKEVAKNNNKKTKAVVLKWFEKNLNDLIKNI